MPCSRRGLSGLLDHDTREPCVAARMTLSAVTTQLTVAREHALLGEYTSAEVYYEGVFLQLER